MKPLKLGLYKARILKHLSLFSDQNLDMFQISTFFLVLMNCLLLLLDSKEVEFQKIYFASLRCNASEKFINQNFSCYAKSYSRNFSTVNVIGTAKMPLSNIFVRNLKKIRSDNNLFITHRAKQNFSSGMD